MGKGKKTAKKSASADFTVAKLPKKKCCESRSRCNRCPLRMLKEGTLPAGYTVKKRKLVKVEAASVCAPAEKPKKSKKQKAA
jgi:hypothetical protein